MKKEWVNKMPVISKIRFTNVIYENGNKRYQDEIFHFDGQNSTIVLENGGGKTVWVQAALQAILPHTEVAGRKAYETFLLSEGCAHIAIEWVIGQKPRRYLVTAVSLYEQSQRLQSYRYTYEYEADDPNSLENIPYVEDLGGGVKRPVDKTEIQEYYARMSKNNMSAHTFSTIEKYHEYLSKNHIIAEEWKKIAHINGAEGGVGKFFENCVTTSALVERLLIPVVEDAISGAGTKNFVESFEKQREHIKRYKQLKHQIEECELILEEVRSFTSSFEKWDQEQSAFNLLKSKAKAVFYLIEKEYEKEQEEHDTYRQEEETISKDLKTLVYKEESYKLHILQKEVDKKYKKYQEALEEFEHTQTKLNKINHRMASLEYAKIRQSLDDSHKEEAFVRQAIQRLSQDNSAAEIEDRLEENSQYLCGYYKNALEQIEKDMSKLIAEKTRSEAALEKDQQEKEKLEKEKVALDKNKTKRQTEVELIQTEMDRLKQSILDMPQHETVEDKKLEFKNRLEEIEKEIRQLYDKRKQLEDEQEILGNNKTQMIKELDDFKDLYRDNQKALKTLEQNHEKVLEKIHRADYKWSHIDSLYTSPLIISSIESKIERIRMERNKARQEERISRRWLDDYENGDYFIADSRILSKIEDWKKEFDLLLTGSEYIQDTTSSNFPYWAITLITTDKEQDKLRGYIEENKDYLSHPIWVMTEYEAGHYQRNDYRDENNFVYPGLWERNIYEPNFKQWKEELRQKAAVAQISKKEIEDTYQGWKFLKQEILDFEAEFPLALAQELRDGQFKLKETVNQKENALSSIYNREKEIIREQTTLIQEESQLDKEKDNKTGRMYEIADYMQKSAIVEKNQKELRELIDPRLEIINPRINSLGKNMNDLKDLIYDLGYALRDKERNKDTIYNQPIYKDIKNYTPLYSSYSEEALVSEREELRKELDKQQKGRRELEDQLTKIKQNRIKEEEGLENQLLKYPTLDQEIRFIREHQAEIKSLIGQGTALEKRNKSLGENKDTLKTQYDNHNGKYKGKKDDFNKSYKEIFQWEEALSSVDLNLQKERKDLTSKLKYIEDQILRISKALEQTKEAKGFLDKKNEHFKYLTDDIKASELKDDEKLDVLYQKTKHIEQIIKGLEQAEEIVLKHKESLTKEEQRFTHFCRSHITNMKLQNLTLKGIENLVNYQEVSKWESNLHNRIMKTKTIAEDDIKTHAEELELFINFIHSYVKEVADALGEIHRKTRVKIEGKWKDVYTIKVPEWDKLKGKEAIQNHVLWIIEQLESGRHPEETHRREIEKWLSVKQLLAVVTQNSQVIVKCRKLTNQNTLAPLTSSWESTNKWSGGERWSKNMILFLGLLNFLAEKTGHLIEGQKRNRTVILDNPFGQASSDHVLNPVFFVAEQLGFQIITLTALAEGSFIRKYFPVVYSCRLRTATDGSQIMAKEQQIQRALFKDDELPSVGRLETQEQMSLLGD